MKDDTSDNLSEVSHFWTLCEQKKTTEDLYTSVFSFFAFTFFANSGRVKAVHVFAAQRI